MYLHSFLCNLKFCASSSHNKQTRQLNLWGFTRLSDIDAWTHPYFIRGSLERLERIKRVEVKKTCNQQQQRRKASKVVRRSSISSTATTSSVSVERGDHRPRSPVAINNDEVSQVWCSSTSLVIDHQAYGSTTNNQLIVNAEKNSSTTTFGCFPFLPFSRFSENGVNHSVEPYFYPTNSASLCENDENFMFELSQILGIETRPRLVDLDSILSWNEVPDDLMDL